VQVLRLVLGNLFPTERTPGVALNLEVSITPVANINTKVKWKNVIVFLTSSYYASQSSYIL